MVTYLVALILLILLGLLRLYIHKDENAVDVFSFIADDELKLGRKFLQKKIGTLLTSVIVGTLIMLALIVLFDLNNTGINIVLLCLPLLIGIVIFGIYINDKNKVANKRKKKGNK